MLPVTVIDTERKEFAVHVFLDEVFPLEVNHRTCVSRLVYYEE